MSLATTILHVVPSFGFGGMEKVICSIINLTSEVYNHKILSLDSSDEAMRWITQKNVKFFGFVKPKSHFHYFAALYEKIKKINPDLLMTYNWGATDAIWLGRMAGIKKIIHNEHGFSIDESKYTDFKRDIIRFITYRLSCKIIVVSKNMKYMMRKKYFIKKRKIIYIYNGINTDFYYTDNNERQKVRKEIGLKDEDFIIGFSGRLDPVKNFDLMLEIFESCIKRDEKLKLLIIGDGSERRNIEEFCHKKGFNKSVILIGKKENIIPYLRSIDVFFLTSYTEQMPMSILEAMSLEIPVVATKVGEIPSIIDNEKDGFVLEVNDSVERFVDSLFALKDHERRNTMGKSARDKIINKFQEKIMIQKYRDIVESLQ
jgi:glycosyltransferase involved in cell wall biosynthesis